MFFEIMNLRVIDRSSQIVPPKRSLLRLTILLLRQINYPHPYQVGLFFFNTPLDRGKA